MQVHAPPSARGAAPPALPCFVLGPWLRLAPATGEAASSPERASGAPSPLPRLPPRGGEGAPPSFPGRARSLAAAAALPPLLVSAAPGRRQLMQSFARGAARVKRRCSRLLRPPQTHTPFFPRLFSEGLKRPKLGLVSQSAVCRREEQQFVQPPEGQRRGGSARTRSAGRRSAQRPGRARTAGPFRESGGGRGSGGGGGGRSPRWRATARRRPPQPGPRRAAGSGFVRRQRVPGFGSRRLQWLRRPRTAAAARALAAAAVA